MNHRSQKSPSARTWTREQIRAARIAPLVPLLQKRGLQLIEKQAGNFQLSAFPGLIVKKAIGAGPSATSKATPSTSSSTFSK
jgi:hypothetical protein